MGLEKADDLFIGLGGSNFVQWYGILFTMSQFSIIPYQLATRLKLIGTDSEETESCTNGSKTVILRITWFLEALLPFPLLEGVLFAVGVCI